MLNFSPWRDRSASTRLVLVRPAETDFRRKGRFEGNIDLPLTAGGRHQVERVEEDLRSMEGGVAAVYSGGDQAARETAEVLARLDSRRVRVLPQLSGVSFGLWEGQLAADVRNRHCRIYEQWRRDACSITPPCGEDMEHAAKRAGSAVRFIRKKHRKGSVIIVAADCLRGLIWCALNDQPPGRVFSVCRSLGAVEVAEYQGLS
jgi:broad specificity phosphatase PhoE